MVFKVGALLCFKKPLYRGVIAMGGWFKGTIRCAVSVVLCERAGSSVKGLSN